MRSSRFSTNVVSLYRDFCKWSDEQKDWPCEMDAFTALLTHAGLTILRVHDVALVERFGLAEDVQFMRQLYRR